MEITVPGLLEDYTMCLKIRESGNPGEIDSYYVMDNPDTSKHRLALHTLNVCSFNRIPDLVILFLLYGLLCDETTISTIDEFSVLLDYIEFYTVDEDTEIKDLITRLISFNVDSKIIEILRRLSFVDKNYILMFNHYSTLLGENLNFKFIVKYTKGKTNEIVNTIMSLTGFQRFDGHFTNEMLVLFSKLKRINNIYPNIHLLLKNTIRRKRYYEYLTYCDKRPVLLDGLSLKVNKFQNGELILVDNVNRKIELMRIAVATSNYELMEILYTSGFENTWQAEDFAVTKNSNRFIMFLHEISNFTLQSDEDCGEDECDDPTIITRSLFAKTDNCYMFLKSMGMGIGSNAIESIIICHKEEFYDYIVPKILKIMDIYHDYALMLCCIFRNKVIFERLKTKIYFSYESLYCTSFYEIVNEYLNFKSTTFKFPVDWNNLPEVDIDEKLDIYDSFLTDDLKYKISEEISLTGDPKRLRYKLEEDLLAHLFYDDLPESYFNMRRDIIGKMYIQRLETLLN